MMTRGAKQKAAKQLHSLPKHVLEMNGASLEQSLSGLCSTCLARACIGHDPDMAECRSTAEAGLFSRSALPVLLNASFRANVLNASAPFDCPSILHLQVP